MRRIVMRHILSFTKCMSTKCHITGEKFLHLRRVNTLNGLIGSNCKGRLYYQMQVNN